MSDSNPQREYIRHTVNVPLQVSVVNTASPRTTGGVNISHGGLAFTAEDCLAIDQVIALRIPSVDPPFEARARVAWCRPEADHYLVGVQFLDADDAFRSRMVQQVCAIDNYREEVLKKEGRVLDSQQAAAEWIALYAGRFPNSGPTK
jgi:c-di-GMP-binding flagellar brake protein YcgR